MNIDLRAGRIAAEQLRDRMMLLKRMILGEITQRPADDPIRVPTPGSCSPTARASTGNTPPAPSYGFHNPAPASAPRLPAQAVAPDAARHALDGIVSELRGTAAAFEAAAAHLSEAANALEAGRREPAAAPPPPTNRNPPVVAPLPHGGRRAPQYRTAACVCGHAASQHPRGGHCDRCDCFAMRAI